MPSLNILNQNALDQILAVSAADAALITGLSTGTIRAAVKANQITSYLVGRRRVILKVDLLTWITTSNLKRNAK